MCGITGIYAFNLVGRLHIINLTKATQAISSRGPDFQHTYFNENVGLGHRRLAIIDTSSNAVQPMIDDSGRYVLIYNGEVYNFKELRKKLENAGVLFRSESDTEVLLNLLIKDGPDCLNNLNGFFSFAFYDSVENSLLLARDRYGIKPLYYLVDGDKVIFASEMKSIFEYGVEKHIDYESLLTYLQLNYIPAPYTILKNIYKLEPGHYLHIKDTDISDKEYYTLPEFSRQRSNDKNYESRKEELRGILEQSVVDRLYADVPLGAFLSGGVDSSIISALAARHTDKLHTFSIGFRDEPFFDETKYAIKVSKHIGSEHTIFKLSNRDMYEEIFSILDYLDEPFADSSAIAVYMLSRETRKHATVALSGDGADELFGGYNKHRALFRMLNPRMGENIIQGLDWLWAILPQSRNTAFTNKIRQLSRFATSSRLDPRDRYWMLASIQSRVESRSLLAEHHFENIEPENAGYRMDPYLKGIHGNDPSINQYLDADMKLVLPNDMLTKVDLMSMAHGLEVRVPFLDQRIVEFAVSLPGEFKVDRQYGKLILRDTFSDILPRNLFNRSKQGFEVPLLKWFRKELKSLIWDDLLAPGYIDEQGIFNRTSIRGLRARLNSSNPGDSHATIWALVVFQWWYRKYFS